MPATIRLMRIGKKGHPYYRIVVMDKRKKRNGAYLEKLGSYDPLKNPPELKVDEERLNMWLGRGVVLSEGITKLKLGQQPPKQKEKAKSPKTHKA